MKVVLNLFCLVIALLAFHVRTADATLGTTCQKIYTSTVNSCALNLTSIAPTPRANVQSGCVNNALAARTKCVNNPSGVCLSQCQATYNNEVNNVCPATCGTDSVCLDICNANALTAYNSCTAACP
jgi:hypothetical protein